MKIRLFSIPISITSKSQALAVVSDWLTEPKVKGLKLITTPNPEMIVAAQSDPEFLKALQSADLAIPDGIGIVWALKRPGLAKQGQAFKGLARISGLDFMEALIEESAKNGWKVMLLGGKKGVGEKVKRHCEARQRRAVAIPSGSFAPLRMTALSGPQDISLISKSDNDLLISQINTYSPDLLFVAFGHGKQEKWLNANRKRLNVGVAMGVGGALDQIADPSLRPPYIINSIGLGWLYRLFREPWRWRRQLSLVKFIFMVINHKRINA